jgi:hypothetical protein
MAAFFTHTHSFGAVYFLLADDVLSFRCWWWCVVPLYFFNYCHGVLSELLSFFFFTCTLPPFLSQIFASCTQAASLVCRFAADILLLSRTQVLP